MKVDALEGAVAILPTPLSDDGSVDEAGVRHLVGFCADRGLDGAVVLGSNGEFPYLRFEERKRVMAAAAEGAEGRIPVIGTASAHGTDEAVALARTAREVGCDAVMAALPLYFGVRLGSVRAHYEAIAGEGGLPVFFYYYPEVSGLVLRPRDFEAIAGIDGVVGAKVTVPNARFVRKVVERTRPHGFRVFAGISFLLERCLAAGGAGVFCPLPLVAPEPVLEIARAFRAGDRERARELQGRLYEAFPVFSGVPVPARVQSLLFRAYSSLPYRGPGRRPPAVQANLKETLRLLGHPITNRVRRPCREVSEKQSAFLERSLRELGWLDDSSPSPAAPAPRGVAARPAGSERESA